MAEIIKRNKKWQYRIFFKDKDGKQKSKSKSGFRTKAEAETEAREIEYQIKNQKIISSNISFADYFKQWYETYKENSLSRTTQIKYERTYKLIKQTFENTALTEVNQLDYQKMLNRYSKTHSKDTISSINSFVRKMLRYAINDEITRKDFTFEVTILGAKPKEPELKYIQLYTAKKLLNICIKESNFNSITKYEIAFGLLTGCRFGEVSGLTWDCVDFKNKTININKTFDYTGFKPTKNKSSIRIISMSTILATLLQKLKKQQANNFSKNNFTNSWNLVFISNRHKVPSSNAVNKMLVELLRSINLNRTKKDNLIPFHGLRHTHASILISKGVSIQYVSKRLGHSTIDMTLKTYTHLLNEQQVEESKKALEILDNL